MPCVPCRFVEEMELSPDGKGAQRDAASSKASAVTSSSRDSLYKCVSLECCLPDCMLCVSF